MGKGERSMKTLNKQISYLEEVLKVKFDINKYIHRVQYFFKFLTA